LLKISTHTLMTDGRERTGIWTPAATRRKHRDDTPSAELARSCVLEPKHTAHDPIQCLKSVIRQTS